MLWPLLIGCVVAAWAMLRIIGNERQTRIDAIQTKLRIAAKAAEKAAEEAANVPLAKAA
jgi:sorbitol-specific phosphotransferase system component IIC